VTGRVSEGFGGSHNSEAGRFRDVASIIPYYHSIINLSIQNTERFKSGSFRLSGRPGRRQSDNRSDPILSSVVETTSRRGGDEIEGIDLPEVIGNRPVSSGSKAYLT